MLRQFAHSVASFYVLLGVAVQIKFETGQTFSPVKSYATLLTSSGIRCKVCSCKLAHWGLKIYSTVIKECNAQTAKHSRLHLCSINIICCDELTHHLN